MRTIPIHVDAAKLGAINLGKQGESLACCVRFYAPKWYEEYPDAEYQLFVTPPGEATPYLADITQENGVVTWELTENDTTIPGSGSIELILTDGETKIKSVTYRTTLDKSPSSQEPGSAPDVHPTWWENAIKKIEAATAEAIDEIDGAFESEKQEATAAIVKAAEDAIASIPADYTELAGDVSTLKDAKADAIWDESARSASHELHAQRGPMSVTLYGKTTETGTGDKSPDNPYTITGIETATVNAGGDEITLPLLPDGAPLMGNGTVDDTVENDVLSGCDKKFVLDGTQAYKTYSTDWKALTYEIDGAGEGNLVVGNWLTQLAGTSALTGTVDGLYMAASGVRLIVKLNDSTDAATANALLAANPLTVYYRSTDYTPDKDLRVCKTVRKWRKRTFDGSESEWTYDSTYHTFRYITNDANINTLSGAVNIASDRFPVIYWGGSWSSDNWISGTVKQIAVKKSDIGDLDGWRAWLAENPLTVVYQLATNQTYMTDPHTLRKPDTLTTDTVTVTGSGETAVEYPHDTKHYIDSKISELVTLALANQ